MKPCQPFSHAGKRDGTDDARHIWPHIASAIRALRPRYVFLENVAGHLSLGFGDVLADLAEAGYDAQWTSLRASDVGACHGRNRVFILATNRNTDGWSGDRWGQTLAHVRPRLDEQTAPEPARTDRPATDVAVRHTGHDAGGTELGQQPEGSTGGTTEPDKDIATNAASDGRDEGRTESTGEQGRSNASERGGPAIADPRSERLGQHARRASSEEARALASDEPRGNRGGRITTDWGPYRPAVEAWERTLGRVAPAPTTLGIKGQPVLAPAFVEWMMGLPAGWVTDVPGISRTGQLHLLGNGVVPQQARAALAVIA